MSDRTVVVVGRDASLRLWGAGELGPHLSLPTVGAVRGRHESRDGGE